MTEDFYEKKNWADYDLLFSLALMSSTFLSKNIIIWVKTLPYFTQLMIFFTKYIFLNEKRCHLMTFSLRLERERTEARVKSNHKFHALLLMLIRQKGCDFKTTNIYATWSNFWHFDNDISLNPCTSLYEHTYCQVTLSILDWIALGKPFIRKPYVNFRMIQLRIN